MGLKEEVQSWEAEKGGDSAPGELPPKQGGLCPLHHAVPLGQMIPLAPRPSWAVVGAPVRAGMKLLAHCRHSELLWHR